MEFVTTETGELFDKVTVKRYTYYDINDLQTKLTLIAAEKQTQNKVNIKKLGCILISSVVGPRTHNFSVQNNKPSLETLLICPLP